MNLKPVLLPALIAGILAVPAANAGIVVFKDGAKYVKIGGRLQLQYHSEDPDSGTGTDEIFFRRLRPYIEGSLHKDWKGKFQWDMGGATGDNEIAIKDAYMQYKGMKNMKVTIGNANFPFSRELLTSSKYQQLVERTFVGDHNYGTPDRNTGVHLTGHSKDKKITWGASIAGAAIDPSASKLDFDTLVNKNADFNEGWMIGGRVDFHPFGKMKFSQGDFSRKQKATIGIAAFSWDSDGDNDGHAQSVDNVTGFEISGAYRNAGFSIDAQYNSFDAETVNPALTSGLFTNGGTTLENWAIEGGYMIIPNKLEIVAGFQSQDADGYATEWERASVGANWYVHKHDVKFQLSFRQNENKNGTAGNDEDEVFLQAQYVF